MDDEKESFFCRKFTYFVCFKKDGEKFGIFSMRIRLLVDKVK